MKVQSIFTIDYYDNVHPTGVLSVQKLTCKDVLLELLKILDGSPSSKCIQAFSDDGRFFLVHRHSFVITYCGRFTPYGDDVIFSALPLN